MGYATVKQPQERITSDMSCKALLPCSILQSSCIHVVVDTLVDTTSYTSLHNDNTSNRNDSLMWWRCQLVGAGMCSTTLAVH